MKEDEIIATHCRVKARRVYLHLKDGRDVSFPVSRYHLLEKASDTLLTRVKLCLGGRALRWEELDEDIWIASAVHSKHPTRKLTPA